MTAALTTEQLLGLYEKYRDDLAKVRAEQAELYRQAGYTGKNRPETPALTRLSSYVRRGLRRALQRADLRPQLDDIEAEITYLLLREAKPEQVVEISPCGGWSSCWILRALRDNGRGKLDSYDIIDLSARNVPKDLSDGRWTLHLGDVKQKTNELPKRIDYLFIDSDHSADFARWYLKTLLPMLKPGTPVSIHDVFHTDDPGSFDGEGAVVMEWLSKANKDWYTASRLRSPGHHAKIMSRKQSLKLMPLIHHSQANSMIYFRMS